jgi:hypothetical protein
VAGLNYLIHEPHLMENQNKVYFFSPTLDQKLINFQKDHPDNFIIVDEFNVKTFQEVIKNIKETVEKEIRFRMPPNTGGQQLLSRF